MDAILEYLNFKLEQRGKSLDGRPIWRLVWSTTQTERRLGEFSDFYGNIFLRTRKEVRVVPKYWNCPNRWILERLCFLPPNAAIHREVLSQSDSLDIHAPTINGTYEPIYVFQDKNNQPLPVTESALEAILYVAQFGERRKLSDSEMRDEYDAALDLDAKFFEAQIQEKGRSPLFAFENSTFIDSTKVYKEKVEPDAL